MNSNGATKGWIELAAQAQLSRVIIMNATEHRSFSSRVGAWIQSSEFYRRVKSKCDHAGAAVSRAFDRAMWFLAVFVQLFAAVILAWAIAIPIALICSLMWGFITFALLMTVAGYYILKHNKWNQTSQDDCQTAEPLPEEKQ